MSTNALQVYSGEHTDWLDHDLDQKFESSKIEGTGSGGHCLVHYGY